MAPHSSVLAWRIPGTGEPGGLPSMGSHRVGHDGSDLAAAAAAKESDGQNEKVLQPRNSDFLGLQFLDVSHKLKPESPVFRADRPHTDHRERPPSAPPSCPLLLLSGGCPKRSFITLTLPLCLSFPFPPSFLRFFSLLYFFYSSKKLNLLVFLMPKV